MIRLLTWNMAHRDLWGALPDSGADVALLQEAAKPRADVARELLPSEEDAWSTAGWPKCGFTALWEHRRLDLAVEAVILRPEFETLFSDEEREIARERLASYGYGTPA